MKKFLIILIALAIMTPVAAHAFSFVDVVNFGKNIFHREAQPSAEEIKKEAEAASAQYFSATAGIKYQKWREAFGKNDLGLVAADSRNLYFTDTEINYLVSRELALMSEPVARDVAVTFEENLIKISGYSLLKVLSGQFYLEAKIAEGKDRIYLKVIKAKYKKIGLPPFVAEAILRGQVREAINFLYSGDDYQDLKVTVGSGFIELNYNK